MLPCHNRWMQEIFLLNERQCQESQDVSKGMDTIPRKPSTEMGEKKKKTSVGFSGHGEAEKKSSQWSNKIALRLVTLNRHDINYPGD